MKTCNYSSAFPLVVGDSERKAAKLHHFTSPPLQSGSPYHAAIPLHRLLEHASALPSFRCHAINQRSHLFSSSYFLSVANIGHKVMFLASALPQISAALWPEYGLSHGRYNSSPICRHLRANVMLDVEPATCVTDYETWALDFQIADSWVSGNY